MDDIPWPQHLPPKAQQNISAFQVTTYKYAGKIGFIFIFPHSVLEWQYRYIILLWILWNLILKGSKNKLLEMRSLTFSR